MGSDRMNETELLLAQANRLTAEANERAERAEAEVTTLRDARDALSEAIKIIHEQVAAERAEHDRLHERLGEAEKLLDEWHGAFTANAEMRTREWLANVIARTSAFLSEHP